MRGLPCILRADPPAFIPGPNGAAIVHAECNRRVDGSTMWPDETPNLKLPFLLASQAQKHVTHNEAIRALDCLVQTSVLDRDLAGATGSTCRGRRRHRRGRS